MLNTNLPGADGPSGEGKGCKEGITHRLPREDHGGEAPIRQGWRSPSLGQSLNFSVTKRESEKNNNGGGSGLGGREKGLTLEGLLKKKSNEVSLQKEEERQVIE